MSKLGAYTHLPMPSSVCLKKILWIVSSLLLSLSAGVAQHGAAFTYTPSQVIKHRDNLNFEVPAYTQEVRLTYSYQTDDRSMWARYWRAPRININALWVDFGDRQVLGRAYAILPELQFDVKKGRRWSGQIYFGTGIAYLDRPYDAVSNPDNNAIGSRLNNTTSLKIGAEYQWTEQLSTAISLGLLHFSNGLSSSPNAGINTYGLGLSANYLISSPATGVVTDAQRSIEEDDADDSIQYRKWIGEVQYQYGFTEFTVPDGPKYGVQTISAGAGYRYRRFLTVYVGAEYEYNERIYFFSRNLFEPEDVASRKAKNTLVYAEHELRFGPVFNRLRVGFYLGWPAARRKTNYAKMTTGLYLPRVRYLGRPFVAVVLKTHAAVADFLAVSMGVSF